MRKRRPKIRLFKIYFTTLADRTEYNTPIEYQTRKNYTDQCPKIEYVRRQRDIYK